VAKLPRITAGQFIRALQRDGWFFVRQRGSHRFHAHTVKPGIGIVPWHAGKALRLGLLGDMVKGCRSDSG